MYFFCIYKELIVEKLHVTFLIFTLCLSKDTNRKMIYQTLSCSTLHIDVLIKIVETVWAYSACMYECYIYRKICWSLFYKLDPLKTKHSLRAKEIWLICMHNKIQGYDNVIPWIYYFLENIPKKPYQLSMCIHVHLLYFTCFCYLK